jgi:hypothetical protein
MESGKLSGALFFLFSMVFGVHVRQRSEIVIGHADGVLLHIGGMLVVLGTVQFIV